MDDLKSAPPRPQSAGPRAATREDTRRPEQVLSAVVVPTLLVELERIVHNLHLWSAPGFFPGALSAGERPSLVFAFNNGGAASAEARIRDAYERCKPLAECFSGLEFIYLDLTGDRDAYLRDYTRTPPPEGFKAGPNNQFFDTLARLADRPGYAFFMETDCVPIRAGWLTRLQAIVSGAQPFWVMGSAYRGGASLDPEFARHINGNAVYAVGDPGFQAFAAETWRKGLLKFIQEHDPRVAYDIFLDWMFTNEINGRNLEVTRLYLSLAHRFIYTDFLQNRSTDVDNTFFVDNDLASFLRDNPETYLLHGAIFARAAAMLDTREGAADPLRLGVGLAIPAPVHVPQPPDAWTSGRLKPPYDASEWRLKASEERHRAELEALAAHVAALDADRVAKQAVIDGLLAERAARASAPEAPAAPEAAPAPQPEVARAPEPTPVREAALLAPPPVAGRSLIWSSRLPLLLALAVAIFHVLAVLSYTARLGRLAMVPVYDDVVYLTDSLNRLAILDSGGVLAFLRSLGNTVAHSPVSTIIGTFGTLVSQGAPWGPYLANGVWVLAAVGLSTILLRGIEGWARFGVLVALLATPLLGLAVAEFRPDMGWGLLVGFALAFAASVDLARVGSRTAAGLGLLVGLAILSKPSGSPGALAVIGFALLLHAAISLKLHGVVAARTLAVRLLVVAGAALVVLLPYFATSGGHVLRYIVKVLGEDRAVWEVKASWPGHLTYYLDGTLGPAALGWIWYAGLPVVVGCGALLAFRRDNEMLLRFGGLLASVGAVYAIATINTVKTIFIGGLLYGAIVALVIWCVAQILRNLRVPQMLVAGIGAAVFLAFWTPKAGVTVAADPLNIAADVVNNAIAGDVAKAIRAQPTEKPPTVLISVPGPMFAGSLDYLVTRLRVQAHFITAYVVGDWDRVLFDIARSQIIISAEEGMKGQLTNSNFPSVPLQNRLIATLRDDPAFEGRIVYTDADGKSVWMFTRKR